MVYDLQATWTSLGVADYSVNADDTGATAVLSIAFIANSSVPAATDIHVIA